MWMGVPGEGPWGHMSVLGHQHSCSARLLLARRGHGGSDGVTWLVISILGEEDQAWALSRCFGVKS